MDSNGIAGRKFIFAYNMDKIIDMRFRIGQEVVCIKKGAWHDTTPYIPATSERDPNYNEIVVVKEYHNQHYMYLQGFANDTYHEKCFAPILENLDEIKEVLEIKETLYEKVPQDSTGTN